MTGITNGDLKNARNFKDVYIDFLNFIDSKDNIFGTWGTNDLKELHRNINFYNLSSEKLPTKYINIQQHASNFCNNPIGKCIGLQNAISILQLEQDKKYHNALNDAYYTALIFKKINIIKVTTRLVFFTHTNKILNKIITSDIQNRLI